MGWDAEARGALTGLNRDSGRAEIVRAALEAVGYQTIPLIGDIGDRMSVFAESSSGAPPGPDAPLVDA